MSVGFIRNLARMRQNSKLPEWYLMSMQRAKNILGKNAKQLERSAKIENTTVEELLIDAQTRIRWQGVPKKDQGYLKIFTMFDQPGGRQRIIDAMDERLLSKGFRQEI